MSAGPVLVACLASRAGCHGVLARGGGPWAPALGLAYTGPSMTRFLRHPPCVTVHLCWRSLPPSLRPVPPAAAGPLRSAASQVDPAVAAWASRSIPPVAQKLEVYRLSTHFRHGWAWLGMAGHGWAWLGMAGHGWAPEQVCGWTMHAIGFGSGFGAAGACTSRLWWCRLLLACASLACVARLGRRAVGKAWRLHLWLCVPANPCPCPCPQFVRHGVFCETLANRVILVSTWI
jgi:hypothetical protein